MTPLAVVRCCAADRKRNKKHAMVHVHISWPLPDMKLGDIDMEQRSTDSDNVEDGQ